MKNNPLFRGLGLPILAACCVSFPLAAQDPEACLLLEWDTVSSGTYIDHGDRGECEYEVDIDNPNGYAGFSQVLPTDNFDFGLEHWIEFSFTAVLFDQSKNGHFRIMALHAENGSDLLVALDLKWKPFFGNDSGLSMQAEIQTSGGRSPFQNTVPLNISNAFSDRIFVALRMVESSEAEASDGLIELWVDGQMVQRFRNQKLDWPYQRTPNHVSFGVVEVFDPQSSGKLLIAPRQPAPYNPDF